MLLAQQVVYGLYRIESNCWHFYEHGVPVAHCSVPKTGEFQCLQLFSVLRLAGDETCGRVYELRQIERFSCVVFRGANQVYGVEVGSLLEHSHRFGVVAVYLRTFKYLQADGVIAIVGIERAATGLAAVPYHSAYTHRTVELFEQVGCQFLVAQLVDVLAAAVQIVLQEVLHTLQIGWRIVGCLQFPDVFESLFLQRYQYACYYLLPRYGFRFQSVGRYIVDILDEYHVGVYVVKILNERTVPSGAEQKRAVVVAERRVVGVCCYGIGAWLLLRESNVEVCMVLFLVPHAAYWAASTRCSSIAVRSPSAYLWNSSRPFGNCP